MNVLTSIKKIVDDLILELRVNWETRPRGYSPKLGCG
jgi:hypothetical protein